MIWNRVNVSVWLVVVGMVACASGAQNSWRLVGRDLREERVELTRVAGGVVWFVDAGGRPGERALSEVVAAVHELPASEREPRELPWISRQLRRFSPGGGIEDTEGESGFVGRLELTDGEVWRGTFLGAEGESVSWFVDDRVVMSVGLDRVRAASVHGPIDGALAAWGGVDDRVVLVNGDLVDGFVAGLGEQVRVETEGGVVSVPMDRVAGVLLSNPSVAAAGMVLRTTGGSVFSVDEIEVSLGGRVSAVASGAGEAVPLVFGGAEVRSLVVSPDGVCGLGVLEPVEVRSAGGLAVGVARIVDVALGFDGFALVGPVGVRWDLPRAARRFSATATLPAAMWAWGDCEVVVLDGDGREAARERLWADRPRVEINVPLGGTTGLTIEIVSGSSGPVQDRVVFSRPIVGW